MDKNRLYGLIREAEGDSTENIGKIVGDAMLRTDGKDERTIGSLQNAAGGLIDIARPSRRTL